MGLHYGTGRVMAIVEEAISEALERGMALEPASFAPLDQFHIRGRLATEELIELSGFGPGMTVLDVGCGVGGPARLLASVAGCHVVGLDLTEEYISAARRLTEAMGLEDKVEFHVGSALAMPFQDGEFQGAWMQHVNMNIRDKSGLFREIARVLSPGGKFVFHEILAGDGGPEFPVPWASQAEESNLVGEPEFRAALEGAGLHVRECRDHTVVSREWLRESMAKAAGQAPSKIGVGALLGPGFPEMGRNVLAALDSWKIRVVMGSAVR